MACQCRTAKLGDQTALVQLSKNATPSLHSFRREMAALSAYTRNSEDVVDGDVGGFGGVG